MPDNPQILDQADLAATTLTDVYTVAAPALWAAVSSIVVCNRNATDVKVRIALAPGGAVDANEHYIAWNVTVFAEDFLDRVVGIGLEVDDVVRVYSDTANVSVSVLGLERT